MTSLNSVRMAMALLRGRPHTFFIFVTNRCNSRCRICNIWAKKPKEDLSVEVLRKLVKDPMAKGAHFVLQGGEFFMHPQYDKILEIFKNTDYTILTNGVAADLVINAVKKHKIKKLNISLDGDKQTYKKVRGVDAYDNVLRVIKELKDRTKISLTYTVSALNIRKDFIHVQKIARENHLDLGIGIYQNVGYLGTKAKPKEYYDISDLLAGDQKKFMELYKKWLAGESNIPCYSARSLIFIYSNGDVPLCHSKGPVLGNLYKNNLSEILMDPKNRKLQKDCINCRACWVSCYKGIDIPVHSIISKMPCVSTIFR